MALDLLLSDRNLKSAFWKGYDAEPPQWGETVSIRQPSDREIEMYGHLGQAPGLAEWAGFRAAHGLEKFEYSIRNKLFDVAMEIDKRDLRRDRTGQIRQRISDMGAKARHHPDELMTALVIAGESTVCYDGQFFFDTDHSEGVSGTQSNDVTFTVVSATAPTAAEAEAAIFASIAKMISFKDDKGHLVNRNAQRFVVLCPLPFFRAFAAALGATRLLDGGESRDNLLLQIRGYSFELVVNPLLTWTDKFATFRVDGSGRPFIFQEETPLEPYILDEMSEFAKVNKTCVFGAEASRNAGYGWWQHAVLTTFTT